MTIPQHFDNHLLPLWTDDKLVTPAFVYDESRIRQKLDLLVKIKKQSNCQVLYSIKALSFSDLLHKIAAHVNGFSVSSVFESRLAREVLGKKGSVHLCSPGISEKDIQDVNEYCDYISFNSIPQWERLKSRIENVNSGLRINPGISFVKDERYDPCRPWSKLGVPLSRLEGLLNDKNLFTGLSGLHVHSNCESDNYQQLVETMEYITQNQPGLVSKIQWLNLGGGYLLNNTAGIEVLCNLVNKLSGEFGLRVFIEPGKAIVGDAGYLVASVIDMFDSGNKTIAILDTTINHLPEVFEYQYKPAILQESSAGKYHYRLAGASCLSGDLFGDYTFDKPLETGSRIIFANVGAYMIVKASMFNGINLPAIYALATTNDLRLLKTFDYSHYRDRL